MVVLAGGEQHFSEAVERLGFTGSVADLAEHGEGLPLVAAGLLVKALPCLNEAQVGQRASFAMPVADLAEHGEGLVQVAGGLPVAAQPCLKDAQVDQRAGLVGGGQ